MSRARGGGPSQGGRKAECPAGPQGPPRPGGSVCAGGGGAQAVCPAPPRREGLAARAAIYALLLLTMLLWGGTFAAGKRASQGAGPFTVAFFRFAMAGLILLPQLRLAEGSFLPSRAGVRAGLRGWLLAALSALSGLALYNYFFIRGLALTGAGRASVIVTINPALIFVGSVAFFGERANALRVTGVALAILGASIVVSSGDPLGLLEGGISLGDAFLLACALSWAAYSLLGKLLLREMSPLSANAWTCLIASAMLLPTLALSGEALPAVSGPGLGAWGAVAFMGVGGTALGFTFFYQGILRLGPNRAGSFVCLIPFFGVLSGALLFGEAVTLPTMAGLGVSLLGLFLVQRF